MITVAEVLAFYAKEKSHISDPKRLEIAVKHLSTILGKFKLQDVDLSTCKVYRKKRLEKNISLSTIARELGVLKAAARLAIKWKMLKPDKMPIIEIPGNLPKRQMWLLKDELEKLVNSISITKDFKLHVFVRLLYFTASRRRAIEELEWSQVNLINNTIALNKPNQKITKKRRPVIPLNDKMIITDLNILHHNRENSAVFGSFLSRLRQFKQLLKKAGLEYVEARNGRPAGKVTPHTLRHSRATHLLEAGMSIYTVAQLLGDNPLTVQRTYAHACTSNLEQDLKKFSL